MIMKEELKENLYRLLVEIIRIILEIKIRQTIDEMNNIK